MAVETPTGTSGRVEELVGKLDSLASLPEVTARITATVHDPKSTPADLHRIIAHDPALVSRILKLVNSSLHARSSKTDSVERAIVLLGFDAVHNLAVSASIGQLFKNTKLCDEFTARDLWMHCVAVAAAAREIAKRTSKLMAEQAFLAGLLHDVGLLASLQACPRELSRVCDAAKSGDKPFETLEEEIIGCTHSQLGEALARQWGFPNFCRIVTSCHHYPSMATSEEQLNAIIYVADTLCCQDAIGFARTGFMQSADIVAQNGLVPLEVITYARENLPELVSDAVLALSA